MSYRWWVLGTGFTSSALNCWAISPDPSRVEMSYYSSIYFSIYLSLFFLFPKSSQMYIVKYDHIYFSLSILHLITPNMASSQLHALHFSFWQHTKAKKCCSYEHCCEATHWSMEKYQHWQSIVTEAKDIIPSEDVTACYPLIEISPKLRCLTFQWRMNRRSKTLLFPRSPSVLVVGTWHRQEYSMYLGWWREVVHGRQS